MKANQQACNEHRNNVNHFVKERPRQGAQKSEGYLESVSRDGDQKRQQDAAACQNRRAKHLKNRAATRVAQPLSEDRPHW